MYLMMIFERLLICHGYDDVLDNYVLTSNINTVEILNLPEPHATSGCEEIGSVGDLTGIEDFKALKHLGIDEKSLY